MVRKSIGAGNISDDKLGSGATENFGYEGGVNGDIRLTRKINVACKVKNEEALL